MQRVRMKYRQGTFHTEKQKSEMRIDGNAVNDTLVKDQTGLAGALASRTAAFSRLKRLEAIPGSAPHTAIQR